MEVKDRKAIMQRILTAVINHSEKGRKISEMFRTLVSKREYPDYYKIIKNPVALDTMQGRIDSGAYASFEDMEGDFALLVKNAMTYNEPKSEICRDAQTLKSMFETLLAKEVKAHEAAAAKAESASKPAKPKIKAEPPPAPIEVGPPLELFVKGKIEYRIGDFVLIANPLDPAKPTIGQILTIYSTAPHSASRKSSIPAASGSSISFTANWYLRPEQTFHKATAKFMENEVLKSNRNETHTVDEVIGRCWVLYVKDYIRGRPKDCKGDMKHVYVCESRYNDQAQSSARIKQWVSKIMDEDMEMYPSPIVPVKVASVFAEEKDLQPKPVKEKKSATPAPPVDDHMQIDSIAHVPPPKQSATTSHHHLPTIKIVDHQMPSKTPKSSATHGDGSHADKRIKLTVKPMPAEEPEAIQRHHHQQHAHEVSNIPSIVPPPPSDGATAVPSNFDMNPDGQLKWYTGVPVDIVETSSAKHSLEYLYFLATKQAKAMDAPKSKKRAWRDIDVEETIGGGMGGLAKSLLMQAIGVKMPLR